MSITSPPRAAHGVAAMLLSAALAVSGLLTAVTPASALPPGPGQPGTPASPVVLYHEDFENAADSGPSTALVDYVSAGGYRYTAQDQWADPAASCNGFVLSGGNDLTGLCNDNVDSHGGLRSLADVLGQINGSTPATNSVVAAYTSGPAYPSNLVEFSTQGETIPLPTPNRFVTFSVNAAATSCWAEQPLLSFSVLTGGTEIPISGAAINPCTDPRASTYAATLNPSNDTFKGGEFASDGSFLTNGSPVGIVMRNESGATAGNDGAFDDIKLLDVTPQLDKSFTPTRVPVGGVSTLTLTVTNTAELAAKSGWQFTDTLPDGLVVADPAGIGGTCDATTTATPGGNAIQIRAGKLAVGEVSCTITVQVTSETPRGADPSPKSYENCAENISDVIGIDLPGCAEVEFYSEPKLTLVKTSDAGANVKPGDIVRYTVKATNTGTGDYTSAAPAVLTDDMTGVLDDAAFNGDATADRPGAPAYSTPKLTWSGALPVGASVTLSYTVTIKAGGDHQVRNVVFNGQPTDPTPDCDDPATSEVPCDTVEYPVVLTPNLAITKTSDVHRDAKTGDVVTYTVTATNTGDGGYNGENPARFVDDMTGVLDDATYNDDAKVTTGTLQVVTPKIAWSGDLEPGQAVTLTYSVTLTDGGDRQVRNVAFVGIPTDPTPDCIDAGTSPVPCDTVEFPMTPPAGPAVLAYTGSTTLPWLLGIVVALGIGGIALLATRRRRA